MVRIHTHIQITIDTWETSSQNLLCSPCFAAESDEPSYFNKFEMSGKRMDEMDRREPP